MPQIKKIMSDSDSTQKTNPRDKFSENLEGGSHNRKVPNTQELQYRAFFNFDFEVHQKILKTSAMISTNGRKFFKKIENETSKENKGFFIVKKCWQKGERGMKGRGSYKL